MTQKPTRVFIDPPTKTHIYKPKWVLISVGLICILTAFQYFEDPLSITTIGFFDTVIFENVPPILSVLSSIIAAIVISPIIEFEYDLLISLMKRKL